MFHCVIYVWTTTQDKSSGEDCEINPGFSELWILHSAYATRTNCLCCIFPPKNKFGESAVPLLMWKPHFTQPRVSKAARKSSLIGEGKGNKIANLFNFFASGCCLNRRKIIIVLHDRPFSYAVSFLQIEFHPNYFLITRKTL